MKIRSLLALGIALALASELSAAPIIHYTFDSDTGTTATDSATGNGQQNATITGGSFVTDAQRGRVLSMTGTGQNANFATLAVTSTTSNYTFATWYKGTDAGYLFDQQTTRLVVSVEAGVSAPAGLAAYNNGTWRNSAATTANDNSWNHIAWVFQGGATGSLTIYLNGVAQDVDLVTAGVQTQLAIGPIPNLAGTQRLFSRYVTSGGNDDPYQLTGLIDDFRIYDHALSASEIAALVTPPPDTLAPAITGLNPQGPPVVSPAANLVATFSENIALKSGGTITLTDTTDGSGTQVIVLPDSRVSVSGADLVINPATNLEFSTGYEVAISGGALQDLASTPNAFPGTSPGQWTFTTAAAGEPTAPAPTGLYGTAPTSAANADGKISGVSSLMEYKKQGDSNYTAVTGAEITGLTPGTYWVRFAAATNTEASLDASVAVPAYGAVSDLAFMSLFASHMVIQRDKPIKIWGTYTGGTTGASISVTLGTETNSATCANGKWSVEFPARSANKVGQPITITSGPVTQSITGVLIGDVWLCSGQSNMRYTVAEIPTVVDAYKAIATNRNIRVFSVPKALSSTPRAEFTNSAALYWSTPSVTEVTNYSAYAYAFAHRLQNEIDVPVGIICSAYGGTLIQHWLTPEALAAAGTSYGQNTYNIMIHPMVGARIKGILWYQGESNVSNPADYRALFREYLNLYRNIFNDANLPVITTQLPKYVTTDTNWAEFRVLQWKIAQTYPDVHIVSGIDLGVPSNNLHPYDKLPFGTRAAELTLNQVYGKNTPGESPYPTRYSVSGNKLTITFGNAESGLQFTNSPLRELYLVAADGTKALATATINGNRIEATAAGIASPKGAQYAMTVSPSVNFYASNGLPVAPFRSNNYSNWVKEYGLSGAPSSMDADVDFDGLSNFKEYALGGNPTILDASDRSPGIQIVGQAGSTAIHYTHTERTDDPALKYTVENSTTLLPGSWTSNGIVEISRSDAGASIDTVTSQLNSIAPKKFVRLKIEQP